MMNRTLKSLILLWVVVVFLLCSFEVCQSADDDKDDFGDTKKDTKKGTKKKGGDKDEFGDTKKKGDDGFGGGGGGGGAAAVRGPPKIPKTAKFCDGVYLSYIFMGREKLYPFTKNVTAQAWAFKSQINLVNMGITEVKAWRVFIGFHNKELLISAEGGVLIGGDEFPAEVGKNGTIIGGYPMADLKTSIETAGDYTQISTQVTMKGTQFGIKPPKTPMPKTIKLDNEGFKCPAPTKARTTMRLCCRKDKKVKKKPKTKLSQRRYGDLNIMYDVLQAFGNNYMAQVTMDIDHPLGRLDHWNLTWEWMRGEFIYNLRGAYSYVKDPAQCIYGPVGQFYGNMDFTQVVSCERKPTLTDLPAEMKNDDKMGKLPYCCRNGTILPKTMNASEARSIFQLQVFKIPPDQNITALFPPQNWRITGTLNPFYKCGPPVKVEPSEFPDPTGLKTKNLALASWQVVCNITRPKEKENKCCVTFSAYYNDSVVPCNTCACGCEDLPEDSKCSTKARSMLLPPNAVLVPFDNRTKQAIAWSKMKKYPRYDPMPCPDNCGVSINWHVDADFKSGWTARMTLFNWGSVPFENWFAAVQVGKATRGFERVYSFNGTLLEKLDNTVFLQGLLGMNYLIAETNGSSPSAPRVPGKQQSVLSFNKKQEWKVNIPKGDGFPTKLIFNGQECALPKVIPKKNGTTRINQINSLMTLIFISIVTFFLITDQLH